MSLAEDIKDSIAHVTTVGNFSTGRLSVPLRGQGRVVTSGRDCRPLVIGWIWTMHQGCVGSVSKDVVGSMKRHQQCEWGTNVISIV